MPLPASLVKGGHSRSGVLVLPFAASLVEESSGKDTWACSGFPQCVVKCCLVFSSSKDGVVTRSFHDGGSMGKSWLGILTGTWEGEMIEGRFGVFHCW